MDQAAQDRQEKRRYRRWQHEDWDETLRRLLPPAPPGETIGEIRDFAGRILREIREPGPDTVKQFLDTYGGPNE